MKRTTIKDLKDMAFELPRYSTKAQLVSIRKIFLSALEYIEDLYEPKKNEDTKDLINDSQRLAVYKYLKPVDDSEKVELSRLEISRLLAFLDDYEKCEITYNYDKYEITYNRGIDDFRLIEGIILKLNKMLKEKE